MSDDINFTLQTIEDEEFIWPSELASPPTIVNTGGFVLVRVFIKQEIYSEIESVIILGEEASQWSDLWEILLKETDTLAPKILADLQGKIIITYK